MRVGLIGHLRHRSSVVAEDSRRLCPSFIMIRHSIGTHLPTKDHTMHYCHHCGNALGDDARSCGACGTPRQTASHATEVLPAAVGAARQPNRALVAPSIKRPRPAVVTWAVGLMFAYALSVVVNGVISGVRDEYRDPSKSLIVALVTAVPAVFVYKGKRPARIIAWVVAGVFLPTILAAILDAGATSAIAYPLVYMLDLVAVVVLLAMPAANDYFRKAPATATAGSVGTASLAPVPASGKPAKTPMSGALKLLIGLGAVVVAVILLFVVAAIDSYNDGYEYGRSLRSTGVRGNDAELRGFCDTVVSLGLDGVAPSVPWAWVNGCASGWGGS